MKTHTHSGNFIVEEFLEVKGCSSDTDCFSVDGQLVYTSFNSQHFDMGAANPYTPAAYTWPATISNEQQELLKDEIQRLLHLLNMKTTIYNVETRECTNGKSYIMEVSPRGGGNRLAEVLEYITDVDLIKNTVRASVGDPIEEISGNSFEGCWAQFILHSNKEGIYEKIEISEELQGFLVERDIWVTQGDTVHHFSGANETIGTLLFKFDLQEQAIQYLKTSETWLNIVVK